MRVILFCLLLLSGRISSAQSYIGAEVAHSADIFTINDPGGYMRHASLNSALWGLNFRHMVLKHFFVETGLYARAYHVGVAFNNETENITTDRQALILPFRAGLRIPLFEEAVSICPVAGIALAMSTDGDILKHENQLDYRGSFYTVGIGYRFKI
jgi:hypothetical protein